MKKISAAAIAAFLADNGVNVTKATVTNTLAGRYKNPRHGTAILSAKIVLEAIEKRKVNAMLEAAGLQEIAN